MDEIKNYHLLTLNFHFLEVVNISSCFLSDVPPGQFAMNLATA